MAKDKCHLGQFILKIQTNIKEVKAEQEFRGPALIPEATYFTFAAFGQRSKYLGLSQTPEAIHSP